MSRGKSVLLIALALALAIPFAVEAKKPAVYQRPLEDFLQAQGVETSFFAHPDISGWVDPNWITFALVDYPGVIAEWLLDTYGVDLGTEVAGNVWERPLRGGGAEITVKLRAKNALGFAQAVADIIANGFDFEKTATIFGQKGSAVGAGAEPALGWAHLDVSFVISEPGADLPDLIDVLNDPGSFEPVSMSLISTISGTDADGDAAMLRVYEAAESEWVEADGEYDMIYSKEVVQVKKLAKNKEK